MSMEMSHDTVFAGNLDKAVFPRQTKPIWLVGVGRDREQVFPVSLQGEKCEKKPVQSDLCLTRVC